MTPARSVAASVAALGFASTFTAPIPALANPTPCPRIEHFAAQSGAEVLRINRLDLGPLAGPANKSGKPAPLGQGHDAAHAPRPSGAPASAPSSKRRAAAKPSDALTPSGNGRNAAKPADALTPSGNRRDAAKPADALTPSGNRRNAAKPADALTPSGNHRNALRPSDEPAGGKRLGSAHPAPAPDAPVPPGSRLGAAGTPRLAEDDGSQDAIQGGSDPAGRAAGSDQRRGGAGASPATTASVDGSATGAAGASISPPAAAGAAPAEHKPNLVRPDKRTPQSIGGVGLGDARSVLIADGPVNSAAAARILDGRVAGPSARNDLVVQQAPPSNEKPTVRRTGERRFGPLRAGAGEITAHARWNTDMTCASNDAQVSGSSTEISRITVTGAGSDSLLRVPEKISGLSDTAVRQRDGRPESVAWATVSVRQISLADGAVRIRVLRAPELRVSMSSTGKGEVQYRPAVVEISDRDGRTKRLSTASDSIDITLREEAHALESLPALIKPSAPLPLPPVGDLPLPGEPENTPAPAHADETRLRISLGNVRQATKGNAIAARATAIRVSLVRGEGSGRTKRGYGPSPVVADLGIGLLEGAAVAPTPAAHGQGVSSAGVGAGAGARTGTGQLPITGPGAVSLLLAGAGLLISGAAAVFVGARRRRSNS